MGLVDWAVQRDVPGGRVRVGFTSRAGGVSSGSYASLNLGFHVGDRVESVSANRRALSRDVPGLAWMDQVHGAAIAEAQADVTAEATDALVVDPRRGRAAAAVMVADCVPLLVMAGNRPLAAAVHVGRGGLLAGIGPKAVAELRLRGGEDLSATLGPSICGRCYEVPEAMRDEAEAVAPGAATATSWGSPAIDIPRALIRQLEAAGVEKVVRIDVCTFEDASYFSHRRACAAGEQAGRFAGIVEVRRDTPS